MTRRLTLSQLKKYDVNQKVLEALADAQSRSILFSVIKEGKTASELAEEHRIPLSSVYKKISDLEDLSLIKVEKWILSDNGKKFKIYKSRISKADVSIRKPEPVISLFPN
jgi:predicted transcriptional regulator